MFKRITLFLLTNVLVVVTISIVMSVFGVRYGITRAGIDYWQLMICCLVWGFVGAFISLQMSRWAAKWSLGIQLVSQNSAGELGWLYNRVSQIAQAAGLPKTPEIGVYNSPEVNAFATGPSKRRALVAFSSGLLGRMSREEIEGVAAHELSHIVNGDMVTMTLLQGVINAFVMFLARVISFAISQGSRSSDEDSFASRGMNTIVTIVLEILLSYLGSFVVLWFSRQREFRADAGSGRLVGRDKMIAALKKLEGFQQLAQESASATPALATMKIAGGENSWLRLRASHPPLEDRIAALEQAKY